MCVLVYPLPSSVGGFFVKYYCIFALLIGVLAEKALATPVTEFAVYVCSTSRSYIMKAGH